MAGVYRHGGPLTPTAEDTAVISNLGSTLPRPRLFDEVRRRLRVKHYSLRTGPAYLYWIRRHIQINGRRHPREPMRSLMAQDTVWLVMRFQCSEFVRIKRQRACCDCLIQMDHFRSADDGGRHTRLVK